MLFKDFIKKLTDEVKGYKARLDILNNSEMDFEDVATDEELEIYDGEDTPLFDFFEYYNTSNIRNYIGRVIEKLVEDDSRFNDVIVWYFDIDGQPELMEELLKKCLMLTKIYSLMKWKKLFSKFYYGEQREAERTEKTTLMFTDLKKMFYQKFIFLL